VQALADYDAEQAALDWHAHELRVLLAECERPRPDEYVPLAWLRELEGMEVEA
jgi:hypothetical protein